ncbi:MAG TPA: hypothetical protein VGH80_00530 [Xanthomonadaceae bacterium]
MRSHSLAVGRSAIPFVASLSKMPFVVSLSNLPFVVSLSKHGWE